MPLGLVGFDRRRLGSASRLVGIDEAGRGCLAGPVVAAAVCCEAAFYSTSWCRRNSSMVDDSKRLSPRQRAGVVRRFEYACRQNWIQIGIGSASIEEIDRHNIYHANSLAMRRALAQVVPDADFSLWDAPGVPVDEMVVLIDGKPIRTFPVCHEAVVKGDQRSLAVALAGIHAKQYRDGLLKNLHEAHPEYGFDRHKGYGTETHLEMIRRHGPCPQHRRLFLRKILANPTGANEQSQDSLF